MLWTAGIITCAWGSMRSSFAATCPFFLHVFERPSPNCMSFVTHAWVTAMKNHACFTSDPTRATVFLTDLETSNAKQYPHYSGTGDWVIGSRSKCQPEDLGRGKDGFRWLKGLDFYKYPERYPNSAMLFLDNYCSAKPKNSEVSPLSCSSGKDC